MAQPVRRNRSRVFFDHVNPNRPSRRFGVIRR
jgi:hypothetical protein